MKAWLVAFAPLPFCWCAPAAIRGGGPKVSNSSADTNGVTRPSSLANGRANVSDCIASAPVSTLSVPSPEAVVVLNTSWFSRGSAAAVEPAAAPDCALAAEPVTVSGATDEIIITADDAGEPFTYASEYTATGGGTSGIDEAATTPNVSIATELAEILAEDPLWYGVTLATRDDDDILRAAAWIESQTKIFMGQSSTADVTPVCAVLSKTPSMRA